MRRAARLLHIKQNMRDNVYAKKIAAVTEAVEQLSTNLHDELQRQMNHIQQDLDETDRMFDEMLKMRQHDAWQVIDMARRKQNGMCMICLDEFKVRLVQYCEESEYVAVSCCGQVFHANCLLAAEKERDLCVCCN